MIADILLFAAGLALLVAGAEGVVKGGSGLGAALGVSPLAIGLTVVAFGTSSPELVVSVHASLRGASDVAVGNVVGSNIFNLLAILGPTAIIAPLDVHEDVVRREVPVMVLVTLLLYAVAADGAIGRGEGAGLLAGLALYLAVGYRFGRRTGVLAPPAAPETGPASGRPPSRGGRRRVALCLLLVGAGLTLLVLGGRIVVQGAVALARDLGATERVIALTLVAGGTSLPELATSMVAAVRREADIAVGNLIGSNVFNVLAILGAASVLHPLAVAPEALRFDLPVALLAALAAVPIVFTHGRVSRGEGILLTAGYAAYLWLLL